MHCSLINGIAVDKRTRQFQLMDIELESRRTKHV